MEHVCMYVLIHTWLPPNMHDFSIFGFVDFCYFKISRILVLPEIQEFGNPKIVKLRVFLGRHVCMCMYVCTATVIINYTI